jgi:ATP-binding cassette subfamily B protein
MKDKGIKNKKKKKDRKTWIYIKKCIPYFLLDKISLVVLMITSILTALINSFIPALSGYVLDFITNNHLNKALFYLLFTVVLALISDYLRLLLNRSFVKVQNMVVETIRKDIINSYFNIQNKILIKTSSGVFLSRIQQDPRSVFNAFASIRSNMSTLLSNFFVIFYIFYLNWVLGIIAILGTVLVYIIEKAGMRKYVDFQKSYNKKWEKNSGIINEGIKGVQDIKLLNIVGYFKDKINGNIDEMKDESLRAYKIDTKYELLRDTAINIFTFAIVLLSIYFIKFNVMSVSSVIVVFMYRSRLFQSILYLAWSERNLKEFSLAAARIFEVMDSKKFSKETYGNKRVNELKGNIEFKNVKFSYGKEPIIKNINFKINEKDTVAIVGRSGSGKTTIINLLNRTYLKDSGSILIDGHEINSLDKHSLRRNISVISQNPYIFNMSIKENLKMVSPHASMKQIQNVCMICEIHDYIMTLPKKYNTVIGEGGVNLSGGEKQRLAIARALLMKTNIMLFDEATSALDNETQAKIHQAINNISGEYTMLIIAHRLSTIKDCNKIIVIDHGKVTGIGNHKELYENNETYKTLYENELQK